MCSHYESLRDPDRLEHYFGATGELPLVWNMFPRKQGMFIRGEDKKAVLGRWGLVPAQTRPDYLPKALKLPTSNARWETANERYSFRNAWSKNQRCIVPAESIFEPDWRTGKSIPTRFTRSDGAPIAVAGLWDAYKNEAGQWELSYTMLTMNADDHPLFKHYHREGKEKRMVLILPEESYKGWLDGEDAAQFLRPFEPEKLIAMPAGEEQ